MGTNFACIYGLRRELVKIDDKWRVIMTDLKKCHTQINLCRRADQKVVQVERNKITV